ncbi:hypothetical protein HGB07_06670 [Candidatus Roizmanbacteria bacterium]|nr:hypothetical protein [Candidatus Roizmanbacteria bacterium]
MLLYLDFDGTMFEPILGIPRSMYYNIRISRLIKKYHLPFVISTGRRHWKWFHRILLRLLFLPDPDMLVISVGSKIFVKKGNKYELDQRWEDHLAASDWAPDTITPVFKEILDENDISYTFIREETHVIRANLIMTPFTKIELVQKHLQRILPPSVSYTLTEKIRLTNSHTVFTGEFLIINGRAGKDNALEYLLTTYYTHVDSCLIAGDATLDTSMLLKRYSSKIPFFRLGVNLQPHARDILEKSHNPKVSIYPKYGSRALYETILRVVHPKGVQK